MRVRNELNYVFAALVVESLFWLRIWRRTGCRSNGMQTDNGSENSILFDIMTSHVTIVSAGVKQDHTFTRRSSSSRTASSSFPCRSSCRSCSWVQKGMAITALIIMMMPDAWWEKKRQTGIFFDEEVRESCPTFFLSDLLLFCSPSLASPTLLSTHFADFGIIIPSLLSLTFVAQGKKRI